MVKDEMGVPWELGFVFRRGEVVESGAGQAGAVFAGGGLAGFEFVAEGEELFDFGDDAELFLGRWDGNPGCFGVLGAKAGHFHTVPF